jgi:hypothetical protein
MQQQYGAMGIGLGPAAAPGSAALQQQQQYQQQQQHMMGTGWSMHGGAAGGVKPVGMGVPAGHGGMGGVGVQQAWAGHDDVSNLMRNVASGGKHDPAFDFVSEEFKKR